MTKFSPLINSTYTSDLLLPFAYDYDDCLYRHFTDKTIFTFNLSYVNAKYIIVTKDALDYIAHANENSPMIAQAVRSITLSWPCLQFGHYCIYHNPKYRFTNSPYYNFFMSPNTSNGVYIYIAKK